MTVFEAESPSVNEPLDYMFCDSDCACWTEEFALDRWTNEGGALYRVSGSGIEATKRKAAALSTLPPQDTPTLRSKAGRTIGLNSYLTGSFHGGFLRLGDVRLPYSACVDSPA